MSTIKVVHYINQFYAGIGGEDKAGIPASLQEGAVGPGLAFKNQFGDQAEIVATIVCGDSYFNENMDAAAAQILDWIKSLNADLLIAGPAFNAGRYGVACGTVCAAATEKLGIASITGMYAENPGVEMFRDKTYIVPTKNSAAGMRDAVKKMAPLAIKLARREKIGASCEEGYLPRGERINFFENERGSKRAVEMLMKKLTGQPFETEYPMPSFDRVAPSPALENLSAAAVALVTSGGIVPRGNPDHIEASNASRFGEYSIAGLDTLSTEAWETAHGGYDPVYANEDPNRILPVDVLRKLEKEGVIGKLHNLFYSTVGNGTAVASARNYAKEIVRRLLDAGVNAVILTST
jgi:glycine reductase